MKNTDFEYCNIDKYNVPEFGFKIHISATIENYSELFLLLYPYLCKEGVVFKYLKNQSIIEYNFSDRESPAESGKFITIYPRDDKHCKKILENLYSVIPKKAEGIYILSDRNFQDSNVIFYRYGCLEVNKDNLEDGFPTLYGPNGEKWQDYQKTYFDLPSWIEDLQEHQEFNKSYLSENYQVIKLLKQGNGGNVYLAQNKSNDKEVVIKESKPHILCFVKIKRQELRKNEWIVSGEAKQMSPRRVEKVREWINNYYIYEYIDGINLSEFCDQYSLFSYRNKSLLENYEKFKKLMKCFGSLLETVAAFHTNDIVMNDIHPDNFVIDYNYKITFIDLENSYVYGDDPLTGIYSVISLKEWNKVDGKKADCHKLGRMLLYLLGRLQNKCEEQRFSNIDKLLLHKGIKSNISKLIKYLNDDSVDIYKALDIFKEIYCCENTDVTFSLNTSNIELLEEKNSFLDCIAIKNNRFDKYNIALKDNGKLFELLKHEKGLGLNGAAGALLYLNSKISDSALIDQGIDYIISNLVNLDGARGVKISEYCISPYLIDGTAGIIQMLLRINPVKYIDLAEELSPILFFEFAQFVDFCRGMLGISDTLLKLFHYTDNVKYLDAARELIISSAILSETDSKRKKEIAYVISKYKQELLKANQVI